MNRQVPFLDLHGAYLELKDMIDSAVSRVLNSGQYIRSEEVASFEREFAAFCGARHTVGLANGLDALTLSLRALEVGPGDEVIAPANTFVATWLAVTQTGARIVPVDPAPDSFNIDAETVERAISSATKVIIPVHLYGIPAELQDLENLAKAKNIHILEDCAQAHGAIIDGRRIGATESLCAWSFYPGKNLGALGDGGAITTNDERLANIVRNLGNYGSSKKYQHDSLGTNSRLDEIQAAILREKLKVLDEWNSRRKDIAARYLSEITNSAIKLPRVRVGIEPVWHLFVIECEARDQLQAWLAENGILTQIHYPFPCHKTGAYLRAFEGQSFPRAELLSQNILSLPIGPHLSELDVTHVITAINSWRS